MATEKSGVDASEELLAEFGENASYVAEQLSRYRSNPESVDEEWRAFFRERFGEPAPPRPQRAEPAAVAPSPVAAAPPPVAEKPLPPEAERQVMRGGALRIAENMEASLQVPTATSQGQIPIKLLDENRG
jgi:2-oxoglutarate dehydrogenase E1 component